MDVIIFRAQLSARRSTAVRERNSSEGSCRSAPQGRKSTFSAIRCTFFTGFALHAGSSITHTTPAAVLRCFSQGTFAAQITVINSTWRSLEASTTAEIQHKAHFPLYPSGATSRKGSPAILRRVAKTQDLCAVPCTPHSYGIFRLLSTILFHFHFCFFLLLADDALNS